MAPGDEVPVTRRKGIDLAGGRDGEKSTGTLRRVGLG